MKWVSFSGGVKGLFPLVCLVSLCLLAAPVELLGGAPPFSGAAYCSVPPSAGSGIKPNLLLMLDNSASMYDPAYTDTSSYCVDDSFVANASYPGYFDENTVYSYSTLSGGKFVTSATALPLGSASCNSANLDYLCVNLKGSTNRTVDRFFANGRFLNWLAMSKLDIEKLVLTGGKFQLDTGSSSSGMLVAETRGCQGKRFVKIAKDAPDVTFGVRGPVPGEQGYLYRSSLGGGARIEIYDKKYNKQACLSAASDWQSGTSFEVFKGDALACLCPLIDSPNPNNGQIGPSRGQLYIDVMSNCYPNPPTPPGNVLSDCQQRILVRYNNNPANVLSGQGEDVCAGLMEHPFTIHPDGHPDSHGFIGDCLTGRSSGASCSDYEVADYCRNIGNPLVMDPPGDPNIGLPNFILDAGIYSLGTVAATYRVRVAAASQPTGLIQEFSNEINFGAMIFNSNGAAAECRNISTTSSPLLFGEIPCLKHCMKSGTDSGAECQLDGDCTQTNYTCQPVPTADGGKVISPVGSALGDHKANSGLIAAVDLVSADAWTPLAESFYNAIGYFADRSKLQPLQEGDFGTPSPAGFSCQKNNVLFVTDGISTADRRTEVSTLVANSLRDFCSDPANPMPSSMTTTGNEALPAFQGSYNLDDLAWLARNKNINDLSKPPLSAKDYISTYVVYTGVPCGAYNSDGSCKTDDEGVPEKLMQLTASKGGGRIGYARNSAQLEKAFRDMLQSIASGSGSGTSILSSGDGNGAIYLQEQFYPSRSFDGGLTSASWIGELQGLWYYIDPFLGGSAGSGSTIREDSDGDLKLNLKNDRMVSFRQDAGDDQTYAYTAPDSDGDGVADLAESRVVVDQVKSLWRAGRLLWARDLSAQPRNIYTPLLPGGTELTGTGLMRLNAAAATQAAPYLNLPSGGITASTLLNYLQGFDFPADATIRSRGVAISGMTVPSDPGNTGVGVWKLGDIISSTPQVQSSVPLGSYHLPAPGGYSDSTYRDFISSDSYTKKPGMIYVGANDGMLHAFNLGTLNSHGSGDIKATLTGPDLGKEQWAFVPRNALPYLKYLAEPNYQHLYFVDGSLTLVDASIGVGGGGCSGDSYWSCTRSDKNWRSILIGGMGLGGASCDGANSSCVATPMADPSRSSSRLGYSSYFALDVTDPNNPALLWEFSDPALGYATTGPAIVRIKSPGDSGNKLNGKWYAVFGSGPTGPIEQATHQFKGQSQQPLQFFVVDLRTGSRVATVTTGIDNAFAGQMSGAAIDVGRAKGSYQDDAIYVGYSKANTATVGSDTTWSDGGVVRIQTKADDAAQEDNDPNRWQASPLISGTGPVTAAVAKLQDRKNHQLWLYFGTGRYFFGQDDMGTRRALYAVKEPCYNVVRDGVVTKPDEMDTLCSAALYGSDLSEQTSIQDIPASSRGWFIQLERAAGTAGAERLVSKPVSTTSGAVFFATFAPSTDPCLFGGTYLWGVKYDTGGAIPPMEGKALVQLGTGGMQETGLSGRLTSNDGRRTPVPMTGRPGGLKIVSNSGLKPLKKIIHIQER